MLRNASVFALFLVLVFAWGCASAPVRREIPAGRQHCLLLTTNDSESHFDGERLDNEPPAFLGTISRVARAKKHAMARLGRNGDPGVLLLEGGDVLQGRYLDRKDGDRALAARLAWQMYDEAGYDFGSLGNHEFDGGAKVLREAIKGLKHYRILAANIDGKGTDFDAEEPGRPEGLYGKTALVTCGGIKVGIVGLLTPSTKTISQFGNVRFTDPDDPVHAAARRSVAELKAQGAQILVALTHLGTPDDVALAKAVPELDVIVGGHSHTALHKLVQVGTTLITQAGARFQWLGGLDLVLQTDKSGVDVELTSWALVPIDHHLPQDYALEAKVAALRAELEPEVQIGTRSWDWDVTKVATSRYGQAVTHWLAIWAEAWLGKPVDAALLNTGGFRSYTVYPKGPVTNLEVAAIHPFRNEVTIVELSGPQVRDVAEHACMPDSAGHGQRVISWGLTWSCDVKKPAVTYEMRENKPVRILRRGERVVDLKLHGKPISDADVGTIRLATIDYLQRGGSGNLTLSEGKVVLPEGKTPVLMQAMVLEGVKSGRLDKLGLQGPGEK